MTIDPLNVPYLRAASGWVGTAREKNSAQNKGETIAAVQTEFQLIDKMPVDQDLRLDDAHSI